MEQTATWTKKGMGEVQIGERLLCEKVGEGDLRF